MMWLSCVDDGWERGFIKAPDGRVERLVRFLDEEGGGWRDAVSADSTTGGTYYTLCAGQFDCVRDAEAHLHAMESRGRSVRSFRFDLRLAEEEGRVLYVDNKVHPSLYDVLFRSDAFDETTRRVRTRALPHLQVQLEEKRRELVGAVVARVLSGLLHFDTAARRALVRACDRASRTLMWRPFPIVTMDDALDVPVEDIFSRHCASWALESIRSFVDIGNAHREHEKDVAVSLVELAFAKSRAAAFSEDESGAEEEARERARRALTLTRFDRELQARVRGYL